MRLEGKERRYNSDSRVRPRRARALLRVEIVGATETAKVARGREVGKVCQAHEAEHAVEEAWTGLIDSELELHH